MEGCSFEIHRCYEYRPLPMQTHLQKGDLAQVEAKQVHPFQEAVTSPFAQGGYLTDVWRDSPPHLGKERWRNKVRRPNSVALGRVCRDLTNRIARLTQNTGYVMGPRFINPLVRVLLAYEIIARFGLAKSGSRDRCPKHTAKRGGRTHLTILGGLAG